MNNKRKTTFKDEQPSDAIIFGNFLKRYRVAKIVRKLRKNFDFKQLSDLTGFSRQYIYGVQEMTIKPNQDFINKLKEVGGGGQLQRDIRVYK